jgi:peptide/nickel transport system permease protein
MKILNDKRNILKEAGNNRMAAIGGAIVILLVLIAISASLLSPHDPFEQKLENRLLNPCFEYPFGTDDLGRCIFSRLIFGTRYSLAIGVVVVGITASVGTTLGIVSGYSRGIIDETLMRIVDIVLAFPGIILALVIAGILGPSFLNVVIAISLTHWPAYTRLVYIMRRHILPNCINPIIVLATLDIAHAIIFATGLSFLGLGIQPPTPEWGSMLKAGIPYFRISPHLTFFPGTAIMVTVMAFNFLGDGLRDIIDPKINEIILVSE